jgi:multiple sugar transport system permease protein
MLINTILISIFTLNTFDLILALTGGGPGRATEVLSLYAYNLVFRNFDLANGSVTAVLLLGISVVFTFFYIRLLPRESDT